MKNVCLFSSDLLIFLLLDFKSSLCMPNTSPVLNMWLVSSFHFVARLFIFLRESFTEYKFLILMRFTLSTFPFMDCGFGVKYKNSSPKSPRFFFSSFSF